MVQQLQCLVAFTVSSNIIPRKSVEHIVKIVLENAHSLSVKRKSLLLCHMRMCNYVKKCLGILHSIAVLRET